MGIESVSETVAAEVESTDMTGAQLLVHANERRLLDECWGEGIAHESPFLIASITKPVTAAAVMKCVEAGYCSLDDPVTDHVAGFASDGREHVTIRHLLTHTSGLPDMLPDNEALRRRNAPRARFVERTLEVPLQFEPGTDVSYQSMGINLAAEIVERRTGVTLAAYMERELFDPAGMDNTFLGLRGHKLGDVVPCDVDPAPGDPGFDRWDWNSQYWREFGAPWGGLHSTARDIARFLGLFLGDGSVDGTRVLAQETVRAMTSNQTPTLDESWGLGWSLVGSRSYFGTASSDRTFGHGGATGTLAWADPARELRFVLLTTRPLAATEDDFFASLSDAVVNTVDSSSH